MKLVIATCLLCGTDFERPEEDEQTVLCPNCENLSTHSWGGEEQIERSED